VSAHRSARIPEINQDTKYDHPEDTHLCSALGRVVTGPQNLIHPSADPQTLLVEPLRNRKARPSRPKQTLPNQANHPTLLRNTLADPQKLLVESLKNYILCHLLHVSAHPSADPQTLGRAITEPQSKDPRPKQKPRPKQDPPVLSKTLPTQANPPDPPT